MKTNISILAIGGGATNCLCRMPYIDDITVNVILANTDIDSINAKIGNFSYDTILFGESVTNGNGAKRQPELGKAAAFTDIKMFRRKLIHTNLLIIVACLGRGTASGASPVIAKLSKKMKIPTIAIVTKPFSFECSTRLKIDVQDKIKKLSNQVDGIYVLENEYVLDRYGRDISLQDAFILVDELIHEKLMEIIGYIQEPLNLNPLKSASNF